LPSQVVGAPEVRPPSPARFHRQLPLLRPFLLPRRHGATPSQFRRRAIPLHRHLRLLPFSSRSIEDAGRLRGSQGGLMSNRCPITDEIGARQLSVEAGKATQGNCRSCRSLDHCAGSRAGCTPTPEIPEYRRELPVKVPWRSSGAAAACGFLDCRSPLGRRRSGSRARTTMFEVELYGAEVVGQKNRSPKNRLLAAAK
jgi:hypothetical protein